LLAGVGVKGGMAIRPFGMFAVMQSLRTPAEHFADLPEFPYAAKYCDVSDQDGGTLRVAWVEDGPDRPVIANAGHFLREDAGEELAEAIVAFLSRPL
jgi:hypothetical protein